MLLVICTICLVSLAFPLFFPLAIVLLLCLYSPVFGIFLACLFGFTLYYSVQGAIAKANEDKKKADEDALLREYQLMLAQTALRK